MVGLSIGAYGAARARERCCAAADRAAAHRQSVAGDRADGSVSRARSRSAARSEDGLGSGRLHVRLVALFSVIAAVPTVLVAIFASVLFQSGLRILVFQPRAQHAREYGRGCAGKHTNTRSTGRDRAVPRAAIWPDYLLRMPIEDPQFADASLDYRCSTKPDRSVIFSYGPTGRSANLAVGNPDNRPLDNEHSVKPRIAQARQRPVSPDQFARPDRTRSPSSIYRRRHYLYVARVFDRSCDPDRASATSTQRLSGAARPVAPQPAAVQCCLLLVALVIVGLSI